MIHLHILKNINVHSPAKAGAGVQQRERRPHPSRTLRSSRSTAERSHLSDVRGRGGEADGNDHVRRDHTRRRPRACAWNAPSCAPCLATTRLHDRLGRTHLVRRPRDQHPSDTLAQNWCSRSPECYGGPSQSGHSDRSSDASASSPVHSSPPPPVFRMQAILLRRGSEQSPWYGIETAG